MKLTRLFLIGLILAVLAACTPMIYGVPQETWDLMTEDERITAMDVYKQRQIAYQQAAAEGARIRAEQKAIEQAQREAELRLRQERAQQIYRGRAGEFGDLLEVSLQSGQMRLSGKKRGYSPVTFKIADGEIKTVPIYYSKGRKAHLNVLYEDRHLWFDIDAYGENTRRAGHLVYTDGWSNGITYPGINSHGSLDMRNVTVVIDVIPTRRGRGHRRPQSTVIVKEKVIQAPPQIIIREKIVQAPPQVIIKERVVQAPPQKVIIKEKVVEKPTKVIIKNKPTQRPKKVVVKKEIEKTPSEIVIEKKTVTNTPAVAVQEKVQKTSEKQIIQVKRERKKIPPKQPARPEKNKVAKANKVHVNLNGGKVLLGGKHSPFKPVNFWISEGETRTVSIVGKNKSRQTLTVCYLDGRLFFDGQPGAGGVKAVKVNNNQTLKIATKGKLSLHNVQVKITGKI